MPTFVPYLRQYRVFRAGIPPQIEPWLKRCPALRELIVPTERCSEARLAMAQDGSREHSFAVVVSEFISGMATTVHAPVSPKLIKT
jgi:hypothetical protein